MSGQHSPDTIREALSFVPSHDRATWINMGMAIKAELGDSGFDIWNEWSQGDDSYKERDAKGSWRSVRANGGITIGTLFYAAMQHGFKFHNGHKPIDAAELARLKHEHDERQRQEARQRAERHEAAAKLAEEIYNAASPATTHPYLTRKKVSAATGVRVGRWYQIGEDGKRFREKDNCLLIPMRDEAAKLWNLQAIFPEQDAELERDRDYLMGGRKQGCYFPIGKPDGTVATAEGYATAQSIRDATGIAVAVAFDKGNLVPVASALRSKLPDVRLIVAADNDIREAKPNYGLEKACEAAGAVGGLVAVPEMNGQKCDFNDLFIKRGPEAVKAAIEGALPPAPKEHGEGGMTDTAKPETWQQTTQRLALLPPIEYDRCREAEAKLLNCRTVTLDEEVKKHRPSSEDTDTPKLKDPKPWEEKVDAALLLNELEAQFRTFVVLPDHAQVLLAIWVVFTYTLDLVRVAPVLLVTSPEKRCGKTTLLELLLWLCCRAEVASNIGGPTLFRLIEKYRPALLVDEADTFLPDNPELSGIFNSGHTRATAKVWRCVGDDFEPTAFSTWAAKAIAMIGKPRGTIVDRSIIVSLRRKTKTENITRLRDAKPEVFERLSRQCARLVKDHADEIRTAPAVVLDQLNDRALDSWEPLFAIARLAGNEWLDKAKAAAKALSSDDANEDESLRTRLLADIYDVLKASTKEKIPGKELADTLAKIEDAPWAEISNGKPITATKLARMLHPFGITSGTRREGKSPTFKGYEKTKFKDAFKRYLPQDSAYPPSETVTPSQASKYAGCDTLETVTEGKVVTLPKPSQASKYAGCDGVTLPTGGEAGERRF